MLVEDVEQGVRGRGHGGVEARMPDIVGDRGSEPFQLIMHSWQGLLRPQLCGCCVVAKRLRWHGSGVEQAVERCSDGRPQLVGRQCTPVERRCIDQALHGGAHNLEQLDLLVQCAPEFAIGRGLPGAINRHLAVEQIKNQVDHPRHPPVAKVYVEVAEHLIDHWGGAIANLGIKLLDQPSKLLSISGADPVVAVASFEQALEHSLTEEDQPAAAVHRTGRGTRGALSGSGQARRLEVGNQPLILG